MSTQDKLHYYEEYALTLSLSGKGCVLMFDVSDNISAIWICDYYHEHLRP